MSNTRRRVYSVMTKERPDFDNTPSYDDFLEMREETITKFIELYDTGSAVKPGVTREELEKALHRFEVENQEQIIHSRNTAEERKRRKIEDIIKTEGTLYDRINADYNDRGSVIDHELAVQHADLLSKGSSNGNQHASSNLINRKTRLIQQPGTLNSLAVPVPLIAEASGCKDLWRRRACYVISQEFVRSR